MRTLEQKLQALAARDFNPGEPGAAIIVTRDGRTLLRAGFGLANVELNQPIQPDMVFRLGSITKQITAVAILILEQRGALSVRDRITKFLPGYPMRGHKITIEHLLTHTSGIKSYTEMPEFGKTMRQDKSLAELIAVFKDQPMDFAPGERWHYNNSGYVLLGAIIEKASGRSYEDFLKRNIFDKLGMNRTYYDKPSAIIPGRVTGYGKNSDGLVNADYLSMTLPHAAGSLASTVDDLAKWDAALYTDTLVKQSALKRAWSQYALNDGTPVQYGYGWTFCSYRGHTCIEHSGGINGFSTHAIRIPERNAYAAVLMNTNAPGVSPGLLCFKLAALAIDKPYSNPTAVPMSSQTLAKLCGRYTIQGGVSQPVILTRKGRKPYIQFNEKQPPQEIFARAPNELFMPNQMLRTRFDATAKGPVKSLQFWDRDTLIDTAVRGKT